MKLIVIAVTVATLGACTLYAQEIDLGPNFSVNAQLIGAAADLLPFTPRKILSDEGIAEELELSKSQSSRLKDVLADIPTPLELRKSLRKRKGEKLRKIGEYSVEEMEERVKAMKTEAVKAHHGFMESVRKILNEDQWNRLCQLIVQHELIRRRNFRLGNVLEEVIALTEGERKELASAVAQADAEVRRVEILKLKYIFFRRAIRSVLGEERGEEVFGKPFGLGDFGSLGSYEEDGKNEPGNVRRRR